MKNYEDLTMEDLIPRKKTSAPTEASTKYVAVKLSSMGKLGLPPIVHVRDYSYSDALKLATASSGTEIIKAIVEVLAEVVQEDIDLDKLTIPDVMEILMTIQGTWYSPSIELPYFVDETLPEAERTDKKNISKITLFLNNLKFKSFPEDKKVPVNVSYQDFRAEIDYPRFFDAVIVDQYIENKYAKLDQQMEEISRKIKKDVNTLEEYKSYMSYKEQKMMDTIKASQAIQILSVNGESLDTLGKRIEAMDSFPLKVWGTVNSYIQNDLAFGIESDVTFQCTVTEKTITRRFSFRVLDFIPTMESLQSAGSDVLIC